MNLDKYPKFTNYKIPKVNFYNSCEDSSTWLTWHMGIRNFVHPFIDRSAFREHFYSFFPDPYDDKAMGEIYISSIMSQLIAKGFNTIAKLSKEMKVKPTELISILRQASVGIHFDKGKFSTIEKNKKYEEVVSKIDPRASLIFSLLISQRYSEEKKEYLYSHGVRLKLHSKASKNLYYKQSYGWLRTEVNSIRSEKVKDFQHQHLLQHLLWVANEESRYLVAWNEDDKCFDSTGNCIWSDIRPRPKVNIKLVPTKSKDKIEFSLMNGNIEVQKLTWWSDPTLMIRLFKTEKEQEKIKKMPIKFKNDELVCAT